MSERLSSVEIEDVLSSIRRLVSEDLRPGAKPAAEVAPPAAAPVAAPVAAPAAEAEKLILTPALRIGPEAEAPVAAPQPEAAMPSFQSVRQGRGASVVDRVTRAMPEEEWEPVGEAVVPSRSDWATEAEAAVEAAGEAWSEAPVAPVEQPADPVIEAAAEAPLPEVLEGEIEIVEAVVSEDWPAADAPEANWAAPGESAPMEAEQPDDPGWSDVEPMVIDRPAAAEATEEELRGEEGLAMPHPQDPTDLGGPVPADMAGESPAAMPDWARMEAEAEEVVTAEPVAAPSATPRADAGWADAAEAEIRRELEEEATATVFARFEEDDHDDRHFDEEMLRDLVRDIIREELQGALGERITRNVRKLVRAEIARALAVRDFE
ncbi:hypothetical protein C0V75_10545 [Tabrizicola sp. TH137]|uniref:hypothetical protein n=1 Tax=Tabrizicola sp. TH137 TaxID=2067452 RepID=UPI000C7A56D6|nr:hypothetical protein [Tabrizicola sp. TH137]PLL12393.1 hypothetical protein C0V75_10545 [Tabrizicola sp. TH137]